MLKKSVQSKTWRKTFRRLLDKMPENIRRWNAALLAMQLGYDGMKIAGEISCLSQPTLHKARQELENGQVDCNLKVTVCHFPSGASKWNPVEHRLFGPISCHWLGMRVSNTEMKLLNLRRRAVCPEWNYTIEPHQQEWNVIYLQILSSRMSTFFYKFMSPVCPAIPQLIFFEL